MKKRIVIFTNAVLLILCLLIVRSVSVAEEQFIKPTDAEKYVGKEKTVCGKVASATYASRTKGQPTFLNLDQPYPNQVFTVVIWGSDRHKFKNPPEAFFRGKNICVKGVIKTYRGKPEVIAHDPDQIIIKSFLSSSFEIRKLEIAERGCCSWHGGVCDCIGGRVVCCDGTFSPSCTCNKETKDLVAMDVSGYTDKGIYVYGDLDVDSSGNVDGYVYTDKGKSIHVEGEIQDKDTVEIDSDSWEGGGYELDIDSW